MEKPDLECDVVMKGGITSGVVYPGAVLALKDRYRFRSIGGTSAGGIAAAVVAAAEHNRDGGGFDVLAGLPKQLASAPGGRPFMLQLFQPDPPARPLFRVIVGLTRWGKLRAGLYALVTLWRPLLAAVLLAAASIALLSGALEVVGVVLAVVLYVAGLVAEVARAIGFLGRNDFGMCRLGPGVGTEAEPALTAWLHDVIQSAAGRASKPVLTFADLWGVTEQGEPERHADLLARSRDSRKRAIDLQMMTTNLTHGRPMRLPSPFQTTEDRVEDGGGLLFDPDELSRFFGTDVVEHLVAASPPFEPARETERHLAAHRRRLLRFPIGPDLPVVVATRMTLSFPVLIAALPLYELDFGADPEAPPLRRIVFSDGGITSNFPVHFFDAPLPARPTFGLNLVAYPKGAQAPADPCASVEAPPAVDKQAYERAAVIDSVPAFFGAIKDAMQNWRDNAQAAQPGFRDRIVDIKLTDKEGGMNLAMASEVIERLDERGTCAGATLVDLFAGERGGGPETAERWNDHRFVRFRIAMSGLEDVLRRFERVYDLPPDAITRPYEERVAAATTAPYAYTQERVTFALGTARAYCDTARGWGTTTVDDGHPRPPSTLRSVPPV